MSSYSQIKANYIGIIAYVLRSDWKVHRQRFAFLSKSLGTDAGFNLFGLWAYDTTWALAMAAEKEWMSSESQYVQSSTERKTAKIIFSDIGISEMGTKLLEGIINLSFIGLSGNFKMAKGQLQPSTFEIFNVVGNNEKIIGFWTAQLGLSKVRSFRSI